MKLKDHSTSEFVNALATDAPAPGGGSVAAYAGAMAAGLCAMVGRLTAGKEKYRDMWAAMESMIRAAERLKGHLMELIDADTDAYNSVVTAFRLPKNSTEEKHARDRAIQKATRKAAEVPLATLRAVAEVVPLAASAVTQGNPNCITDAGTSVQLLRAAAMGAAYNVRINLGSLRDAAFVAECRREVDRLIEKVQSEAERLSAEIDRRLG